MVNPRKLAIRALNSIEKDKAYSNLTLNAVLRQSGADRRESALATALFYGVLDRKISLDYILSSYLKQPINKLSPFTLCALRVGLYQIIYMDSVPPFSAVDETVKILKKSKESRNSGLVNAVLRNYLRAPKELPAGKSAEDISVRYSCPLSIVKSFIADYGTEDTLSLLEESLKPAPVTLRVNTEKISVNGLKKELEAEGVAVRETELQSFLLAEEGFSVQNSDCYKNGLFFVQDLASGTVCEKLSPASGERVLDLCAAPGGKSFNMALLMKNKGEIVSCDIYENRLKLIKNGADRLGLDIIKPILNDGTVFNDKLGTFDRVLADVPCSGFGIMRRKPDIKYKPVEDFKGLEEIQKSILENADLYLKKNGFLLYSTCTLRRDENEQNVKAFLENHKNYTLEFEHTFMPHKDKTDGFYCALFKKQ